MHSPRIYFNNIGPAQTVCIMETDCLRCYIINRAYAWQKVARQTSARQKHAPWKAGLRQLWTLKQFVYGESSVYIVGIIGCLKEVFGADSVPIPSARNTRRPSAALSKIASP